MPRLHLFELADPPGYARGHANSLAEREQLVAPLRRPGRTWEVDQDPVGPCGITWLLGYPTEER